MKTNLNTDTLDEMLSLIMSANESNEVDQTRISGLNDQFFFDNSYNQIPEQFIYQYNRQWFLFELDTKEEEKHFLQVATVLEACSINALPF